jgi:hypothetical protein
MKTCFWFDTGEFWATDCGGAFNFSEAGPEENGFQFCPYCGKSLCEEVNFKEQP